jgi:AcrR family transcriptional regulator
MGTFFKNEMNYQKFKNQIDISKRDICREMFTQNRDTIRIKNKNRVVKNLEKIFRATLKISNRKGFQAMSMRDLSKEAGLSLGALYGYFGSKDELLEMLQHQRRTITRNILEENLARCKTPQENLRTAIVVHLYLSEAMQPWFYFSYMEAKNLSRKERDKAVASELYTEQLLTDILRRGRAQGHFTVRDCRLTASVIKAMLQDWYLKRPKYARRNTSVDQYADFILEMIGAYIFKAV